MHPIEFTWYKAIVLITAAMAIGFGILNIVYFNRLRLSNNTSEVTTSEANTALWLNIILVIFAGILFFWSLFRLIFSHKGEKNVVHTTVNNNIRASPPPMTYVPASDYVRVGALPIGSPSLPVDAAVGSAVVAPVSPLPISAPDASVLPAPVVSQSRDPYLNSNNFMSV